MTDRSSDRDVGQDITEVLVRYATAIDSKDWPLFRSCFTADCQADYGDIGVWSGVDAITDYMSRTHPEGIRSLHRISNVATAREGDRQTARSYVDVIYVGTASGDGVNAVGFYDDELVLVRDEWRIARRRYTMVHVSSILGMGGASRA